MQLNGDMSFSARVVVALVAIELCIVHVAAIMWIPVLVWWFHNGN